MFDKYDTTPRCHLKLSVFRSHLWCYAWRSSWNCLQVVECMKCKCICCNSIPKKKIAELFVQRRKLLLLIQLKGTFQFYLTLSSLFWNVNTFHPYLSSVKRPNQKVLVASCTWTAFVVILLGWGDTRSVKFIIPMLCQERFPTIKTGFDGMNPNGIMYRLQKIWVWEISATVLCTPVLQIAPRKCYE